MEGEEQSTPFPSLPKQKDDERGGGGKIRRQFDRKPLLPYARVQQKQDKDRDQGGGGGGWWNTASRLFSFLSRRSSISDDAQQPHASTGSEEVPQNASGEGHAPFYDIQTTRETKDGQGPSVAKVPNSVDMHGGETSQRPFDSNGISEIEHMFEGKTLSRDEFSRIKAILQSRMTVESDAEEFGKRDLNETKGTDAVVASLSQETPKEPGDEMEEVFLNRLIGESSDPIPNLTSEDLVGASPIDIAKAYMGARTSELGVRSKSVVFQEKTTPTSVRGASSKLSVLSPRPKSSVCWPGSMVQQTHYHLTPQTERGRVGSSSLRTPYSRPVHSSTTSKWEHSGDRSHSILTTNMKHLQTPVYGGQVTRMTNSSFTDGFGSVGPVRRSRRKFRGTATPAKGMHSSPSAIAPSWSESLYARKNFLPMVKQNLEPGTSSASSSKFQPEDVMAPSGISVSTVHPPVQLQSTDTDRRILDHFDRTIATPEKKSAELKLATSWRKLSSSESNTSKGKAPVNNLPVESSDFQLSGVHGQNVIGQENQVIDISFQNDLAELKKTDEATTSVITRSLGTNVLSSEISHGHVALQFDRNHSNESKTNTEFGVNRDEVSIRHEESSQNENINQLSQQSEAGGQVFPLFADTNSSYKAPNVPKKLSAHTFGNKPPLANISITKSNPSYKASSDNGFGFTFPVSASTGPLFEPPPTPSILPSFSTIGLPRPQEHKSVPSNNCNLKGGLSYSFGSRTARERLVFSFPSTSTFPSDSSTPRFTFGSDKGRISFRAVSEDAVCS